VIGNQAMTMYQAGQRVLVKQLHHQHSIDKKQTFLGRVVVVVSSREYKSGTRYFLRLAASPKRTIFLNEQYLEALDDQVLHRNDAHYFDVDSANDINAFEPELRVIHSISMHRGKVEAIEIYDGADLKVCEWRYLDDEGELIHQSEGQYGNTMAALRDGLVTVIGLPSEFTMCEIERVRDKITVHFR